jgi:hypothetical protein
MIRDTLTAPICVLYLGLMLFTAYVGFSVGALEGAAYARAHPVTEFIPMQVIAREYAFRGGYIE